MKRSILSVTLSICTLAVMLFAGTVFAASDSSAYKAAVYCTDSEGLALKSSSDINAKRFCLIPEDTVIEIGRIRNGWGYTSYNGQHGWVALQFTRVADNKTPDLPADSARISPLFYEIANTDGEGLELRISPDVESSTFGSIPDGTKVIAEAINGDWAYVSFGGHHGWANLAYLYETTAEVLVYDTGDAGLAFKVSPDPNSQRIALIPDDTVLNIDRLEGNWGHTTYNGRSGWVTVRYTWILDQYFEPQAPTDGYITPTDYTVVNAWDGLEMRTGSDGQNMTFGPVPEGTTLTVTAIENNWGFVRFNGRYGWVLMTYMQ